MARAACPPDACEPSHSMAHFIHANGVGYYLALEDSAHHDVVLTMCDGSRSYHGTVDNIAPPPGMSHGTFRIHLLDGLRNGPSSALSVTRLANGSLALLWMGTAVDAVMGFTITLKQNIFLSPDPGRGEGLRRLLGKLTSECEALQRQRRTHDADARRLQVLSHVGLSAPAQHSHAYVHVHVHRTSWQSSIVLQLLWTLQTPQGAPWIGAPGFFLS